MKSRFLCHLRSAFHLAVALVATVFLAGNALAVVPPFVVHHSLSAPADRQAGAQLGSSCAVDGNWVVLGALNDDTGAADSGVVKIFDATTGALVLTLADPDPEGTDQFGTAIALAGNRLIVSAPRDTFSGVQAGSVYVYDLAGETPGTPVMSIASPVAADLEFFGSRLSLSGNHLAVAARNNDTGASNSGRAYVFDLASATPSAPIFTFNNPNPSVSAQFGESMALSGNTLVVGVVADDTMATDAGIAYVYDLASGTPTTPSLTINDPDPQAGDSFGGGVAISGSRVVLSAYKNLVSGVTAGSAYIFDLAGATPAVPVLTVDNPSPTAIGQFGVGIVLDGNRLVVAATGNTVGGFTRAGIAYVYDLAGVTPSVPLRTVNNPAPAATDLFGASIVLSADRLLIGASFDDTAETNSGAGYLYDLASVNPTVPVLSFQDASAAADNHFGAAVAVSGSLVAVGLPEDDIIGVDAGSVAIHDLSSATPGTPTLKINTPQPSLNGHFGASVALEGARLVVGAPNDFVGANRAGVAYVFDLSSATPKVPVLTISNPTPALDDQFGSVVAVSGSLVLVGAKTDDTGATDAGSVYVYDMNSATPTVAVYTINNPSPAAGDSFGWSAAISGNRIVVGVVNDDTGASNTGIAYVYDLGSASPTVPVHTLTNPAPGVSDIFGNAVAIDGNRVVVAARGNFIGSANVGSAYEYDLASANPTTPVHTLDNPNHVANDQFGFSLSLSGATLVVGTPGNDSSNTDAGVAFVYDLAGATPSTSIATLTNPTPGASDNFGNAVAIQGSRIVVGAPNSDLNGRDQGAAFVFEPPSTNADLAGLTTSLGTLSPVFASATTTYTADLPPGSTSMTVTPTKAQSGATITVKGTAVTSGAASGSIALFVGSNFVPVAVTAEDGVTTKTYNITANVPGTGTIALASNVFTVTSGSAGTTADITIQRSDSVAGPVTCALSSADGSATAPAQYTEQTGTVVSFADGESTQHVMIPIAANATTTSAKSFTITLGNLSAGATFNAPTTATVVILPPASTTDAVKPVATITAPANAATIVDTLPVTISGTATDNIGIAKVQVSINNGVTFADATVANVGGTSTTYTLDVQPLAGLNRLKVRALDFKGNASALAARTFTHLRTLTVSTTGTGSVSKGFTPTSARQVGKSYSITATPAAGHVFDGWTVNNMTDTGITTASAELPVLPFIMQPGLTLTAKFIVNPFTVALTGNFSGLVMSSLSEPVGGTYASNASVGLCTAKLSGNGALTGTVKIDGLSLPFTAFCDNTGVARFGKTRALTTTLARPGKPAFTLSLSADLTGATKQLTGKLIDIFRGNKVAESNIVADRHAYSAATPVLAQYVKSYTARLKARTAQGVGFTSQDYPQGDGYLTFKVLASGTVTMSGKLADDTAVSMSGNLSQANHWPIFQALYGNKGCIAADAVLDDTQTNTDATAMNMLWFRPFQNVQWYPYGWNEGIYVDMLASKYAPAPATVFPDLAATNSTIGNTDLKFTNGLLTADVTKFVNLTTANVLTKAPLTDTSFTFVPTFTTGVLNGTFTHSDNTKPKWQGVLMQKGTNKGGHGYFMSSKPKVVNYLGESGAMHWLAK